MYVLKKLSEKEAKDEWKEADEGEKCNRSVRWCDFLFDQAGVAAIFAAFLASIERLSRSLPWR